MIWKVRESGKKLRKSERIYGKVKDSERIGKNLREPEGR